MAEIGEVIIRRYTSPELPEEDGNSLNSPNVAAMKLNYVVVANDLVAAEMQIPTTESSLPHLDC